ncbi:hypothetical protein KKG46_00910 [Patescibacteria group bacterium]|nr:hypothetical protein [Patescibacteria group bacterium]
MIDKNKVNRWKIFTVLSSILALILIAVLAYLITFELKLMNMPIPEVNPKASLGQEGAECGGEYKLPCMPGLGCLMVDEARSSGVCIKLTDKDPGKTVPIGE